jgi:hypothetical protein
MIAYQYCARHYLMYLHLIYRMFRVSALLPFSVDWFVITLVLETWWTILNIGLLLPTIDLYNESTTAINLKRIIAVTVRRNSRLLKLLLTPTQCSEAEIIQRWIIQKDNKWAYEDLDMDRRGLLGSKSEFIIYLINAVKTFFFFLVAPTRGSVLPFRRIGLILLSFLIRTVGRIPWTGD